jgi:hypothetical protein
VLASFLSRAVKLTRQRTIQNVIHQRRFARAGNARHHRHHAQRESYIEILEIIFLRAQNRQRRAVFLPPLRPHLNRRSPGDVRPGQRVRLAHDFFRGSVRHQASAMPSRTRAQVDHIIRAADGFFIVLDHEHGVAQVAQVFERGEQPAVVAMMQADRRLVQHVEHAAQLRANLRGQADALAFAAR